MSSINVLLRTEKVLKSGLYPIVVRVIEGTKRREFPCGYRVGKDHWDPAAALVKKSHPDHVLINAAVEHRRHEINQAILEATLGGKPLRLELIGERRRSASFTEYLRGRAADYGARGMEIMRLRVEKQFVDDLLAFYGAEVFFEDIDKDWIRRYDAHLVKKGNGVNYRAKKIRTLRDWYTDAMKEGKTSGPNSFEGYSPGSPVPVKKEKLTMAQVKAIEDLVLTDPAMTVTRDMWLFSFYCKGMRFQNVLFLRQDAVRGARVYWQANKGKGHLSAAVHDRLGEIINRYRSEDRLYLFPWVVKAPESSLQLAKTCGSWNVIANKNLKMIAALAGITTRLTFHVARHTFAFALKKKSNNIHVIKDALDHADTRTTEMYLKELDDEAIDQEVGKVYDY